MTFAKILDKELVLTPKEDSNFQLFSTSSNYNKKQLKLLAVFDYNFAF